MISEMETELLEFLKLQTEIYCMEAQKQHIPMTQLVLSDKNKIIHKIVVEEVSAPALKRSKHVNSKVSMSK